MSVIDLRPRWRHKPWPRKAKGAISAPVLTPVTSLKLAAIAMRGPTDQQTRTERAIVAATRQ